MALTGLVLLLANGCGDPSLPQAGGTELAPHTVLTTASERPASERPVPTAGTGTQDVITTIAVPSGATGSDDLDAAFVADLGLAEGAQVAPNARYRETWRLRNTGARTWPAGTELVFISGDPIPGPQRAPVSQLGPGRDVDISVELTAPAQPARYASYWRLQDPEGQFFGAVVYAEIVVSSDAVAPVTIPDTAPRPTSTLRPITLPRPVPTSSDAPVPAPTRTPTLIPTATSTSGGELICGPLDPRFEPVLQQAGILGIALPCTTSPPTTERGVLQAFWLEIESGSDQPDSDQLNSSVRLQSLVIVREATRTLYVLTGKDTTTYQAETRAYEDTWSIAMPEKPVACAPLVPPPGYIMPTRSIGGLWCEQSLWNSIGWPVIEANAVTLVAQGDRNNLLVQLSSPGTKPYLVAIDLDARAATVYQEP